LTIISHAHTNSAPIVLSEIELSFDGGLKGVLISHSNETEPTSRSKDDNVQYFEVSSGDSNLSTALSSPRSPATPRSIPTLAELTFKPGMKKVFSVSLIPRDSGEVKATRAILSVREEAFFFDISIQLKESTTRTDWWILGETFLSRRKLDLEHHCSVTILPKPPKLQIELPTWSKMYYTDENVVILVQLKNEENDVADIRLHINLLGIGSPKLKWSTENPDEANLDGRSMGLLPPGAVKEETVSFRAPPEMVEYSFEVRADYVLVSDPNTPITKSIKEPLAIISAFEANYEFLPRVHSEPWPSYFNIDTIDKGPEDLQGLKQKWLATSKIASFATEPLIIKSTNLRVLDTKHSILSSLTETIEIPKEGLLIHPNDLLERTFVLEVRKSSLNDHKPATLTFQLDITWERVFSSTDPSHSIHPSTTTTISAAAEEKGEEEEEEEEAAASPTTNIIQMPTTNTLLVPPLTIPFGEPRLIATAQASTKNPTLINMTYTLENPSMHVLTFSLTMEASEEFALSGPKTTTTQLLPLSRRDVKYNILPTRQGVWIKPSFKCVDVGFGKVLRCLPGEGCRMDRQRGLLVWAVAE
jgi:trafficking protein particle complex subunit 11